MCRRFVAKASLGVSHGETSGLAAALVPGRKSQWGVARVSLGVSRAASSSGLGGRDHSVRGCDRDFPSLPHQHTRPPWLRSAEHDEPKPKRRKFDPIRDNLDTALIKRGVKVSKAVSTFCAPIAASTTASRGSGASSTASPARICCTISRTAPVQTAGRGASCSRVTSRAHVGHDSPVKSEPDGEKRHADVGLEPWASLLQASSASQTHGFRIQYPGLFLPGLSSLDHRRCSHCAMQPHPCFSLLGPVHPHTRLFHPPSKNLFQSPVSCPASPYPSRSCVLVQCPHMKLRLHNGPRHLAGHFPTPPAPLLPLSLPRMSSLLLITPTLRSPLSRTVDRAQPRPVGAQRVRPSAKPSQAPRHASREILGPYLRPTPPLPAPLPLSTAAKAQERYQRSDSPITQSHCFSFRSDGSRHSTWMLDRIPTGGCSSAAYQQRGEVITHAWLRPPRPRWADPWRSISGRLDEYLSRAEAPATLLERCPYFLRVPQGTSQSPLRHPSETRHFCLRTAVLHQLAPGYTAVLGHDMADGNKCPTTENPD